MTRQVALIAIVIFAILAGLVAIVARQRSATEETVSESVGTETTAADEEVAASEMRAAALYFPSTGGWLHAEHREVPASAEPVEQISTVVADLLAGPRSVGMQAPLPEGVSVRKVYLAEDGLAFLDFESPEGTPPASGSMQEMLTVYSLVNTVLLNFEELDRIVLLWNGRQLRTFAGHVNTMRPLRANLGLIAQARPVEGGTAP